MLDVAEEQATEDIQKLGGMEALDEPYTTIPFVRMVKKRATWLILLFLGEMLTATAMQGYNSEIEKAAILAMFLPLIISSGGNSGSQATTLVIRAMALRRISVCAIGSELCERIVIWHIAWPDSRNDRIFPNQFVAVSAYF